MNDKFLKILGTLATFTALGMYISYLPQILGNLNGNKGDYIQPFVAGVNCTLWVIYGVKKKDWPIAIANFPGIIFGFFASFTAIL